MVIYKFVMFFRWAVSIVMTRENQIPCSDGKGSHLALIPFLDMCNHCEGIVSIKDSCDYFDNLFSGILQARGAVSVLIVELISFMYFEFVVQLTTDYDLNTDSCICFAMNPYKSGEQVRSH